MAKLKEQTLATPNIFYLDLIGAVELGGVNFVGGTLFFDGSMRIRDNQRVDEWDGWQDWRIVDIESRYMEFNAYYVDMIRAKMKLGMSTALCTHHVPHVRLNGHEPSHYIIIFLKTSLAKMLPVKYNIHEDGSYIGEQAMVLCATFFHITDREKSFRSRHTARLSRITIRQRFLLHQRQIKIYFWMKKIGELGFYVA